MHYTPNTSLRVPIENQGRKIGGPTIPSQQRNLQPRVMHSFYDRCQELDLGSIMKNKDKWTNTFFTKDVFQEVVEKVNLLNNKYINNRYATKQ